MALVEICAGDIKSALAAQEGGAHRIEFCDNLYEGGTTPSYGSIAFVKSKLTIPIHVIIRPRGGDFLYSPDEFQSMLEDIQMCKDLGIAGVVIGVLQADGQVDAERSKRLVEQARPMSVTFHRAFDMTPDPVEAIQTLIELGIDRLLTSGQKNSALDGLDLIKKLISDYGKDIIIMPGGGLNEMNIESFSQSVQSGEYHATLRSVFPSQMTFRRPDVYMGGMSAIPEFDRKICDPAKVAKFVSIVNKSE